MPNLAVIAYDASPDARLALESAAAILPGWDAIIVHAWALSLPPAAGGFGTPMAPEPEVLDDGKGERRALRVADDGVELAVGAGLQAEAVVRQVDGIGDIAAAVLTVATDRQARVVVAGRRGLGRVRAAVLGSVSDTLVRRATLPVLIVPVDD